MNQTFDLNRMGFVEMQNEELMATDGGGASAEDWWGFLGAIWYLYAPVSPVGPAVVKML